jgi:mRNA interferase MazF
MMQIRQYEIWLADLNPKMGSEPGKIRPVLILQTNLLNKINHPSTIVCPLTTNIQAEANILRVHLLKGDANLNENCDIVMDQIRAIDNIRLIKKLGNLPLELQATIRDNIAVIFDLEYL